MRKYQRGVIWGHHYGRWEYTLNHDGSICLHNYHGNTDVLNIPKTLMGRPVTQLRRCFSGSSYVQLVIIPSTVKSIGAHAMDWDEHLRGVMIPPETTFIHRTAFGKLKEKEDFCLFVTEGSYAHTFAEEHGFDYELDAFPELEDDDPCICGDWHYAVIEEGRCVIREYNGTDRIVRVPVEINGCQVVGLNSHSFYGNLFLEELIVPEGVEYLSHHALAYCVALRRVHLPDSVFLVSSGCFAHCRDLEEIRLPAGLEEIMLMAFLGCVSLRSIALPDGVQSIFPMAFHGCRSLEEIRLSPVLSSVPESAFEKCPRLRRPALPDTLNEESRAVFSKLPA